MKYEAHLPTYDSPLLWTSRKLCAVKIQFIFLGYAYLRHLAELIIDRVKAEYILAHKKERSLIIMHTAWSLYSFVIIPPFR